MRKLGYYLDMDFLYDLIFVDYVVKVIVEILLRICNDRGKNYECVFYFFNRNIMFFSWFFDGENIKFLFLEEWRKVLKFVLEDNKEFILLILFFFFLFWDRLLYWFIFDIINIDFLIFNEIK